MRAPVLLLSLALLSPALAHGQAFVHPGILLDAPALQATRDALRAGDPLKTSAMAAMGAGKLLTGGLTTVSANTCNGKEMMRGLIMNRRSRLVGAPKSQALMTRHSTW